MKNDLATAILASVIGVVAAYFIADLLVPSIDSVAFKKLSNATTYELAEPDVNMFNYNALNPTVEVYVGNCDEYDIYGNCVSTDPNEDDEEGSPEAPVENPEQNDNLTPEEPTDGSAD